MDISVLLSIGSLLPSKLVNYELGRGLHKQDISIGRVRYARYDICYVSGGSRMDRVMNRVRNGGRQPRTICVN